MHFSYVKSKILSMWLNILLKFYVTMFSPEHSLLLRSIPLRPPGQPPDPARHPTRPPIPPRPSPHPASHPTLQACLPRQPCQPRQRRRRRERCNALVQSLSFCNGCVWGASQRATPSNFLHTPSNILCTPFNILCNPSKILHIPTNILRAPPILYVNLTCGAVDTRSARPLPPGVMNCGVEPSFLVKTLVGYI